MGVPSRRLVQASPENLPNRSGDGEVLRSFIRTTARPTRREFGLDGRADGVRPSGAAEQLSDSTFVGGIAPALGSKSANPEKEMLGFELAGLKGVRLDDRPEHGLSGLEIESSERAVVRIIHLAAVRPARTASGPCRIHRFRCGNTGRTIVSSMLWPSAKAVRAACHRRAPALPGTLACGVRRRGCRAAFPCCSSFQLKIRPRDS